MKATLQLIVSKAKRLQPVVFPAAILASAWVLINPMGIYVFDLLQSFAVFAMLLFFIASGWLLYRKRYRPGLACLGAFMLLLGFLKPWVLPQPDYLAEHEDLRVAHFNVFKYQSDYRQMVKTAASTNADVISFQEVDSSWAAELEAQLKEQYPHFAIVDSQECCYGLAVFSRHPLTALETHWWAKTPNLTGNILLGDTAIHFMTAHTRSPTTSAGAHRRNNHLRHMTRYLQSVEGPVLAIGDFNAVPWNKGIRDLQQAANMHDSRNGLDPTFPSWGWMLQIPIDYIFHSDELACVEFGTIKDTSSDHFGIVGSYELKRNIH